MAKKSTRRTTEDFLAAPADTVKNKREKQKLIQRKAQDAARKEQERRGKLKTAPTHEDILADVVRVAEDRDTNPFWKHRSISQRRYELYGHYPIEQVLKLGRFTHVKQQAGLEMDVGTRQLLRVRTYRSIESHAQRYMERQLLPHVNKFPELERATAKWHCGVSISDLHGLYLDPFTWDVFLDVIHDIQPEVVYLNGDVIDGLEISSHPKVPGASVPLQLEFDFTRELFKEIRQAVGPKTRVVWGAGNHFLDRMTRYLTQVAPGFAGLRSLRIDTLLDGDTPWLEDLDIDLVQGGSFVSPNGQRDQEPRRKLWDAYLVTHGKKLGQTPAKAELSHWGISGTSGHVHRGSIYYATTAAHAGLSWMSTPMSCVHDAGRWYVGKGYTAWQQGFGVFEVSPKGRAQQTIVSTDNLEATFAGRCWSAKEMPVHEQAVRAYWMDRFGLKVGDYF